VAGLPQSAGFPERREYRPAADGAAALATLGNGAGLLGKTNIPFALGDWQADSANYGRTRNPWNLDRTPGGSTGGGGAALAAGLTPLEVGSDIGGSIRVPAAYCGVWGHRPSETAVPRSGGFPARDLPNPAALMGVQGPLARSAADLELLLDLMSGAEAGEDRAWSIAIPASRRSGLGDFRVAVMPAFAFCPVAAEMQGRVDALASFLSARGATVRVAMPTFDLEAYFHDYLRLLTAMTTTAIPRDLRPALAEEIRSEGDGIARARADGLILDAPSFLELLERRERSRVAWREFFGDWDVLIGPMALGAAFPHSDVPLPRRVLLVDGDEVPAQLNLTYPMLATFAGQPSTAFPAGLSAEGLPLGLQAIGPYLEDRTPLAFAALLEREWQAFVPPPGF